MSSHTHRHTSGTEPSTPLIVSTDGPVRILRINRPHVLNALSVGLSRAMTEAFAAAESDPAIRAIVVTGTGERAFSAGGDLKERAAGPMNGDGARFVTKMLKNRPDTPLIAAINGLAYGGGLELVLACDLAVCADHATFALPEASRGIVASGGGLVRLPHVVGPRRALQLALTAGTIDAREALSWGLVNQVTAGPDVLEAAVALGRAIARNAPLAVTAGKKMIQESSRLPESSAWEANEVHYEHVINSEDAMEGPLAFAERRAPLWKGR
ncbi:enoyl-CoA hydratase/isomerase family protein [Streptomyces sp. NPDC005374]|uniref:enoyl-CoA hydratase/isomerase family protein n=1 Tax=Streptomyces sp. NPDC005374 TaxID=3364713 RepID=UPI0036ACDEF5